ncbi:MAG: type IV pilin [Halobacteriaceae archaeon]
MREDEGAVSPVIGTLLMVSITVIIAAVIGTYVIGLGSQFTRNSPQALIGIESVSGQDLGDDGTSTGQLTIVLQHGGTDTLVASETEIKIEHSDESVRFTDPSVPDAKFETADEMTVFLGESASDSVTWPNQTNLYSTTGFNQADSLQNGPITITLIHTPSGQIISEVTAAT